MQLFYSQAEKTIGISVRTLQEELKKAQETIKIVEESNKEKTEQIRQLSSDVEHLKMQIPDEDVLSRYAIYESDNNEIKITLMVGPKYQ